MISLSYHAFRSLIVACLIVFAPWAASAQDGSFEPKPFQEGKDVVWVPTPAELVEKMLDMAKVTPQDFVVDLGSGDGRNVIAAAKRGARGLGVEYNPDMVELSRRIAAEQGVGDKATFVEGDMYQADFSEATVLALFLLPTNMDQLRAKFLNLKPGTRIVANTFPVGGGWTADEEQTISGDCLNWCTSLLWIVPARVEGTWQSPQGNLMLKQDYQMLSGSLLSGDVVAAITGRLQGDRLSVTIKDVEYTGTVSGDTIQGSLKTGDRTEPWRATRVR